MTVFQAACGLFNDLQAYKEAAIHEQQGFQAPQGLSKPALRNQAALHALLNQEMARQETLSGVLPAADLVAAADELAELAPEVAKVDLLKHSHALHQEDYLAAVDTLYKYFDSSTGEAVSVYLKLPLHLHPSPTTHPDALSARPSHPQIHLTPPLPPPASRRPARSHCNCLVCFS